MKDHKVKNKTLDGSDIKYNVNDQELHFTWSKT